VKGGRPVTATAMKKNDPHQMIDNIPTRPRSPIDMPLLTLPDVFIWRLPYVVGFFLDKRFAFWLRCFPESKFVSLIFIRILKPCKSGIFIYTGSAGLILIVF